MRGIPAGLAGSRCATARMNAKFMPMMLLPHPASPLAAALLALAVAVSGLTLGADARAEKADRSQPLSFAADAARVEDNQRLNILTGNVELTKGTMVLRSDRVEVRQNADGTQTATATGGAGGRAFFRQKREALDEFIEGEAEKVVYEGRTDTVHFTGRAIMRRLRGNTVADQVTGQAVVYDNKTSVFQVLGSPTSGEAGKGRVRGVISPRPAEAEGGR